MGKLGTTGVVNYSNTTSGQAEDVHALNGVGGAGVVTSFVPPTPPGPDNTYTLGVDYTTGGVTGINQFGGHLIQVDFTKWGNPADAVNIISQPIGTLLTFVANGGTHTATTQTTNPEGNNVSVLFNDNPGFLYGTTLDSITLP